MSKLNEEFVKACLDLADNEKSKLTEIEREMMGECSSKLRCLLNNLCSKDNTNYLEIGLYRGSSFIPALFVNMKTKAVGVDNWMYDRKEVSKVPPKGYIWENVKSGFEDIVEKYSRVENPPVIDKKNIKIIEKDFAEINYAPLAKFDVINFDVLPMTFDALDALFEKVLPKATPQQFVLLVNQYSNEQVAKFTDNVLFRYKDVFKVDYKFQKVSASNSDSFNYFSGVGVFGISKVKKEDNK
jgi:hypothetical protein